MLIKYHQKTLELLALDNTYDSQPEPDFKKQIDNINNLPASMLEYAELHENLNWMTLPPDYKKEQEILHFYSNDDWFWICNLVKHKLEEDNYIEYNGEKLLKFSTENQNNFDLAVLLNGSDDPEVYYSDYKNKKWMPHISTFSEFVYSQIFDWQFQVKKLKNGEKTIRSIVSISFKDKEQLFKTTSDYTKLKSSFYFWDEDSYEMIRFAIQPDIRMLLHCNLTTIQGTIMAPTKKAADKVKSEINKKLKAQNF